MVNCSMKKKILRVKDIVIGEGIPNIAVPIVGRSISDIVEREVKGLKRYKF